jgi:outer membrane protein TolC
MGQQHSEKDSISLTLMPVEEFEAWYNRGPLPTDGTLANSPERKALESATQVSREMRGIARSQFLPKVNAFAQLSFADSNAYAFDYQGWTAGLSVNVPLFNGFRSTTNYQKVNNEYRKALLNEQEINNRLSINLHRIALFYQASYQGVGAARKQNQLMERQLTIMQQRYDSGLVNQSQLLEVELGARQTRIGYIQKLFECLLLQAEYQKTIGTLEVTQ